MSKIDFPKVNKVYESVIPDDFKWMKKGMTVKNDPEHKAIRINGRKYISLEQFERTYGPIVSGEKLAQDVFWHIKTLFAWHDVIKYHLRDARDQSAISIHVSNLMTGHDIPEKYVVHQLHWWGFEIRNNIVNLRSNNYAFLLLQL